MKNIIEQRLMTLGMPPNLRGFHYIVDGVELILQNDCNPMSLTKVLYPTIAEIYETKWTRVERSIRSAIEKIWFTGNIKLIDEWFGHIVNQNTGKVTNGEFLYTLACQIRRQENLRKALTK